MAGSTAPGASIFTNRVATNAAWAALLLKDVGAKVTPNNVGNVLRWMAAENPPANWANRNNPLNASLNTNKQDGTGSYSDLTTSAHNTAAMIVAGYKGGAIGDTIYNAMMSDASPEEFSTAVVDSAWASNHYGVGSAGADKPVPNRVSTWFSTIPVPGLVSASSTAQSGSGYVDPAGTSSLAKEATGQNTGCAGKPDVFKTGGLFGVGAFHFSACNAKAFLGAAALAAGGLVMLTGLVLLAKGVIPNPSSFIGGSTPSPEPVKASGPTDESRAILDKHLERVRNK